MPEKLKKKPELEKVEACLDDPVRMYLMEMGRIPMLTREEEVDAAIKIDDARFRFRNYLLANDFMLSAAYKLLLKVHPVSYTHLTLPTICSV